MKNFILKSFRRTILPFFIIAFLSIANQASASHAAGGDITYRYIGNNQYVVTFTFYRDCFGIPQDISYPLSVNSATCGIHLNFSMNWDGHPGIEILPTCTGTSTICNGGSNPGIEEYHYIDTITLPAKCPDWNFSTFVGGRNNGTTTIVNLSLYNLYVDANLNNINGPNNSPVFSTVPVAYECIGQTDLYTQNAIDADGDSLVYSFIAPRSDANFTLPYVAGYSVANPIVSSPPISIDPATGDISMHPTQSDISNIVVQVYDYRNGVIVGSVMREMVLHLINCSNTPPILSGPIHTATTCAEQPLCFDIISGDPDSAQIVTMTWSNYISGATFTTSGSPFPTGHFCWTPSIADARPQPYTFTVTVRDDACPMNAQASETFSIIVSTLNVGVNVTPGVRCYGSHDGVATATTTGNNLSYTWQFPNGTSIISSYPSITHLTAGNYTLNVIDSNGCAGVNYFTITQPPPLTVTATMVNAGCGSSFGSATANASGGTVPYNYSWNTGDTTPSIYNLITGAYTIEVNDAHNCTAVFSDSVQAISPVNFIISDQGATCLGNNGSVTVTHTGGIGPFSYYWSPDIPGDTVHSSIIGLIPGVYNVSITDWGTGCIQSASATVSNTSGLSTSISSQANATCEFSGDGSATLLVTGGSTPYSYLWPNGDTTSSTNHLHPGTMTAEVMDNAGCRNYVSVTTGFDYTVPQVNLGPDTMPCISVPYILVANTGPGPLSYLWSTGDTTGNSISVNASGNYSLYVTDANGCSNADTVTVTFANCFVHHNSDFIQKSPVINIYPNPADDNLNVSIGKIKDTDVTLIMTDILGNNLYYDRTHSENDLTKIIDIHLLPAGIYILRIEINDEIDNYRVVKN